MTTNNLTSLYPLPGSKRDKKYNFLRPQKHHTALTEPFMGGAAKSIEYHYIPCHLGEINPAVRSIAIASRDFPDAFTKSFHAARDRMVRKVDPVNLAEMLTYAGTKNAQIHLGQDFPEVCDALTLMWDKNKEYLWDRQHILDGETAGAAMFQILAAFGNIGMRMNPKGTKFNVSWHIDKLKGALRFSPELWIQSLQDIKWDPHVYDSWEGALKANPGPHNYLLLDPPYCVDGEKHRMTPCYRDHDTGTTKMSESTLELSTKPLVMALELGYTEIHLCNYWSDRLSDEITEILAGTSYHLVPKAMGQCGALGNSGGQLKHGQRQDKRERPIEWIWEITRERSTRVSFAQLDLPWVA